VGVGRLSSFGRLARAILVALAVGASVEFTLNAQALGPAPQPPGTVSLVAAGDIACPPGQRTTAVTCHQRDTGTLAARLDPTVVAVLGDNQYPGGSLRGYVHSFAASWGRLKSRMRPAVGNHEYLTPRAKGYFAYFGAVAAPPNGWYSYDLGAWHVVVLNSNCAFVACGPGSPQETWLRADLASHPGACTLAYFHHPRFISSGMSAAGLRYLKAATLTFWNDLYTYGVDVVLNGHAHVYERFAPQDPFGRADPARGVRQFTVGTGGVDHDEFVRTVPTSQARSRAFGVLALVLGPGSYGWRFLAAPSGRVRDAGSGVCH
jgi:calcineurin-like phosphoesterase family protein